MKGIIQIHSSTEGNEVSLRGVPLPRWACWMRNHSKVVPWEKQPDLYRANKAEDDTDMASECQRSRYSLELKVAFTA